MCRTGGRRCPSHTDPKRIAERNAVRREQYAMRYKSLSIETPVLATPEYPVLDSVRPFHRMNSEQGQAFKQESLAFVKTINPAFNEAKWDKYAQDLTEYDSPQKALLDYTNFGFMQLRTFLHGKDITAEPDNMEVTFPEHRITGYEQRIKTLDTALAQVTPPAEPRLLYRGMRVPFSVEDSNVRGWIGEHFPVDGVISQKNYMSTSINADTAERFTANGDNIKRSVIIEIVSKQGAPLGEGTSWFGDEEKEVLMPRNARFKVVSVDYDVDFSAEEEWTNGKGNQVNKRTVVRLMDAS